MESLATFKVVVWCNIPATYCHRYNIIDGEVIFVRVSSTNTNRNACSITPCETSVYQDEDMIITYYDNGRRVGMYVYHRGTFDGDTHKLKLIAALQQF